MARREFVTDLPLDMIDRERAAIFVAEFIAWWQQAGHVYYGERRPQEDGGLQHFYADAVEIAGGPVLVRRIINAAGVK